MKREEALALIARNIAGHGQHIYLVTGKSAPRYAYTIGCTEPLGLELVLAGGIVFLQEDVKLILNAIASRLREGASVQTVFEIEGLGSFRLRRVAPEWVHELMLGATDYYRERTIEGYQVLPDDEHRTTDIPEMEVPWTASVGGSWRWQFEPWPYDVPASSIAMTDLAALRGARITQAARWEEDEWELFAGPTEEIRREDARAVPLATLIGADPSLARVVELRIGQGLWRDPEGGEWHSSGSR